jgi:hypothetical protein
LVWLTTSPYCLPFGPELPTGNVDFPVPKTTTIRQEQAALSGQASDKNSPLLTSPSATGSPNVSKSTLMNSIGGNEDEGTHGLFDLGEMEAPSNILGNNNKSINVESSTYSNSEMRVNLKRIRSQCVEECISHFTNPFRSIVLPSEITNFLYDRYKSKVAIFERVNNNYKVSIATMKDVVASQFEKLNVLIPNEDDLLPDCGRIGHDKRRKLFGYIRNLAVDRTIKLAQRVPNRTKSEIKFILKILF